MKTFIERTATVANRRLGWLMSHPTPEFEYFLTQYAAARNLDVPPAQALEVTRRLCVEKFNGGSKRIFG